MTIHQLNDPDLHKIARTLVKNYYPGPFRNKYIITELMEFTGDTEAELPEGRYEDLVATVEYHRKMKDTELRVAAIVDGIPRDLSRMVIMALAERQEMMICTYDESEIVEQFEMGYQDEYPEDLTKSEIKWIREKLGWNEPTSEAFWGEVWDMQSIDIQDRIGQVLAASRPETKED